MTDRKAKIRALEKVAYAPYELIEHPTTEDWRKSYDALKDLTVMVPEDGLYANTLGYLCYYGRHTGGERKYAEARDWFEKGAKLRSVESTYKLADMLSEGLGGPADPERAMQYYWLVYRYCRRQFEGGEKESKFADAALRMGRMYHEGKILKKNDTEALGFLLEAKYAIGQRKRFGHYGDDTVEKNILKLIDECEQPDEEMRNGDFYGLGLGRVPHFLRPDKETRMTMDIYVDEDDGRVRLEFRRQRKDGKKPNRILWSVAPAMKCFMTDAVVLYGSNVRQIWRKEPGETVVCDRYEYDSETDTHWFYLGDELQGKLMGGEYVLPMNEFLFTVMRDHPEAGSQIAQ